MVIAGLTGFQISKKEYKSRIDLIVYTLVKDDIIFAITFELENNFVLKSSFKGMTNNTNRIIKKATNGKSNYCYSRNHVMKIFNKVERSVYDKRCHE